MPRISLLAALLVVLAAFFGAAAPALAHSGHKAAQGDLQADKYARGALNTTQDEADEAVRAEALAFPADSAADPCHSAAACCTNHCCVGGAVMPRPDLAVSLRSASAIDRLEHRRPDDAPLEARLRPPCR